MNFFQCRPIFKCNPKLSMISTPKIKLKHTTKRITYFVLFVVCFNFIFGVLIMESLGLHLKIHWNKFICFLNMRQQVAVG